MKKILSLLLAAALSAAALAGCVPTEKPPAEPDAPSASAQPDAVGGEEEQEDKGEQEKVLNIFTWDGYFPQDVLDSFTAETGMKINFSNFETNEEMLTKLQAANAGDYDIIVVSDYMVEIMSKLGGLLGELDKEKLPNYSNLDPNYLSQFYDPDNRYTIPYGPGAPLIVYDPAACPVEIEGYEDLWSPELKDSLVMMDSGRVVIGITLMTMGKTFNETDPAVLDEAKAKLLALKPNIRTLSVNNLQNDILSGEASAGFLFTSQAATAVATNPELKVVYPKEGLGFGIDTLAMPVNAPHKDNAYAFLNYILDAQVGAQISSNIWYLCPNKAAGEYLPEDYKSNPALFLPEDILQNLNRQFVKDVGDATELYDKIWTEFKQS